MRYKYTVVREVSQEGDKRGKRRKEDSNRNSLIGREKLLLPSSAISCFTKGSEHSSGARLGLLVQRGGYWGRGLPSTK